MNLSLNEVEATAKRATRGAGYPWGLAEEAAKATRWLCARGIDGCAILARILERRNGSGLSEWSAQIDGKNWSTESGTLCPLVAGSAISDRSSNLLSEQIHLKTITEPLMLLPFAAQSAMQLESTVTVAWSGVTATTDGCEISLDGKPDEVAEMLTVSIGGKIGSPNAACTRAEPSRETLETLNKFAQRTYAPATEESRLLGAGAGLSDND